VRRGDFVGRNVIAEFRIDGGILRVPRHIPARQLFLDQFRIFGEKQNASLQPNLVRTLFDLAFKQRRNHVNNCTACTVTVERRASRPSSASWAAGRRAPGASLESSIPRVVNRARQLLQPPAFEDLLKFMYQRVVHQPICRQRLAACDLEFAPRKIRDLPAGFFDN
jgi:hypothetical protein